VPAWWWTREGRVIMSEKKADKCNHPGCECPVPKGKKYCSPYCESMFNQP